MCICNAYNNIHLSLMYIDCVCEGVFRYLCTQKNIWANEKNAHNFLCDENEKWISSASAHGWCCFFIVLKWSKPKWRLQYNMKQKTHKFRKFIRFFFLKSIALLLTRSFVLFRSAIRSSYTHTWTHETTSSRLKKHNARKSSPVSF